MSEGLKAQRERVALEMIDPELTLGRAVDQLRALQRQAMAALLEYQHGPNRHHTWDARIDALLDEEGA